MKRLLPFLACLFAGYAYGQIQTPGQKGKQLLLPNGWSLSPAGRSLPLGDLPLNMAVSASKKWIAVTNNGQSTQSLQLIDAVKEKMLDEIEIPKSWYGLRFAEGDRYLYASGGNDNWILQYATTGGKLKLVASIILGKRWPNKISPAGFDIDEAAKRMYIVTKEDNSLYVVDLQSKKTIQRLPLDGEAYTCLLTPDRKQLYISCWGCDQVLVYGTQENRILRSIRVGDNPNELLLTRKGDRLFVANANDNTVSVIDTKKGQVLETLDAALYQGARAGSTTNGLALSEDEGLLYIANADNNCLAVFDVRKPMASEVEGFIPVGWYPTNVKVIGKKIFVTNGKGFSSQANPYGPDPTKKDQKVYYQNGDSTKPIQVQYIAGLFKGSLSIIDRPGEKQLSSYTRQVYANTPYAKKKEREAAGEKGNPIPMKVGDPSPIKYVFYVIKENRTYDQVLGDMKEGNGDPSLVLFGESISPNHHALAREFVLLDNFYVNAEVSADGHNWSMGGYATDYLEKNWPTSYGNRGGSYPAEGNREIANNKKGFIWDFCQRAGVSYRSYGEFVDHGKANIKSLRGHFCPYYIGWDMGTRDTTRFYQWKRDFDSLLAIGQVPQFNSLRFSNDHTEGLRKGKPTPWAHMADNDLALGMFIEHLSRSPIWKETAVFVVEDDAQNGADHVDAHRSIAFLAGGFVKRGYVDHTMYTTTSMLRTMELNLGLPPMSQYDAASEPMWRCFTPKADTRPFSARPVIIDLNDKNTASNEWQRRSEKFNLAKEDNVPDLEFNIVLWHAIKGEIPFPGIRRAAWVKSSAEEEEED